ncbi:ribosome hibernation factor-recruiting GTPase MRF [Sciscionella sediminilitoris]|uniref:ribosome hibernation factor-recruiting GTPase MRF n=1 Tax=Sciscionella sediminilitoris TaxID=1445613 RepID=UPI00068BB53A|nr:GTP-binding protein [Sciscionella sp. SE31]
MSRSQLVLVGGLASEVARETAESAMREVEGAVLVHHDLRSLTEGIVRRTVRTAEGARETVLELAHGCASCTLREDVLPLLRGLAGDGVPRIVLHLDPAMEPESVCGALSTLLVEDENGPGTVCEVLDIAGVLVAVDPEHWFRQATGDETLVEMGLSAGTEDERTVAHVATGAVAFADALVLARPADPRTLAVLDRLAPAAVRTTGREVGRLLERLPAEARRGEADDPHGPLLRGTPPLHAEHGIALAEFDARRPLHPKRFAEAMEVLLDGVVTAWGRIWLASKPEASLWLESAGGALWLGYLGPWLCAAPEEWEQAAPLRSATAALRWDPYYGDREQHLLVLVHEADPERITEALNGALLTDAELAEGQDGWRALPDPFQLFEDEPCGSQG